MEHAMTAETKVRPTGKRNNAFKHGVFSNVTILPGEDQDDFAELGTALFLEWQPDGPTETDAVFTIAKCLWRKRRIQLFIKATIDKRALDPHHKAFDSELSDLALSTVLALDPEFFVRFFTSIHISKQKSPRINPSICAT